MRALAALWLACLPALAALPGWWTAFLQAPSVEARFHQESESLVFGKLRREGRLLLARGGRLRVDYEGGLTVACDGRELIQYDPDTRTAQRMEVARAVRDLPLLGLLLDPARLGRLYSVQPLGGDRLRLVPREPDLPELEATGRGRFLTGLAWTDPTGARQTLTLLDPKTPGPLPATRFRVTLPQGTRWATRNG